MSVFTGTPLYGQSLRYAGPATLIWGWLVVTFFTWFVGIAMAEICSSFPVCMASMPFFVFPSFSFRLKLVTCKLQLHKNRKVKLGIALTQNLVLQASFRVMALEIKMSLNLLSWEILEAPTIIWTFKILIDMTVFHLFLVHMNEEIKKSFLLKKRVPLLKLKTKTCPRFSR